MLFLLALIAFSVSLGIAHASRNLFYCALIGTGLYTIIPTVVAGLAGYTFLASQYPTLMAIGLLWSGITVVIPVVIIALCRPRKS
jgi:hypothetical protein